MILKNADVFQENGNFLQHDIFINGEYITDHKPEQTAEDSTVIDADGLYAIPGLIDIHFHGCMNRDFCDADHESIRIISEYQLNNGITSILPATMTLGEEDLCNICRTAYTYKGNTGSEILGINLEGPFISESKRGAQDSSFILKPDTAVFKKFQEAAGGMIKIACIAPEEENGMEFIEELKDEVILSIAHTAADYETAVKAFEKGAVHVTHLYNAMPAFHHRFPGVVGAARQNESCFVELICDGVLLHPSTINSTFKMFGDSRVIMISDSVMAAGMPEGSYTLGGQKITVTGKTATVDATGALAGSVSNLMECMCLCVREMGIPLGSAVKAASSNPAKALRIYDKYGSISHGKYADIVLLDRDLNIRKIIFRGKLLDRRRNL